MSTGKEARRIYLEEDFNCAEAAWLGVANELTKDEKAFGCRLAGAFGGGLACGHVCGALAGAAMGLGLFLGREPGQPRSEQLPEATEELVQAFQAEFGSVNCRDIRLESEERKEKCAGFVEFAVAKAAEIIDRYLEDDLDCG